jgi:O-antigen ligase
MNFKLNWKGILIPLISLISLVLGRKLPILRWILAVVAMVLICMVFYFALGTLKSWYVLFPITVLILNIGVCLLIKAPRKWILASSITITIISTYWLISNLIRNAKNKKVVTTIDANGLVSAQQI